MAAAGGAATPAVTGQQEKTEAAARFASKHAELLTEARHLAREHGVSVRTVAFRPDGAAVAHEIIGVSLEERLQGMVGRAVARDVAAMGLREMATHRRQLLTLRAVVLGELQARKDAAAAAAAANDDAGAEATETKRALEQRETDGAGAGAAAENSKSRRTDY